MTFPECDVVDLFAGPGGWSVAAAALGLREIGVETDDAACDTRTAAGFDTIQTDVRRLGPTLFPNARGLIASPPCPTFSAAGNGSGRRELSAVLAGIDTLGRGETPVHTWADERTGLTLEPMRWVVEAERAGMPYRWIALEQVPAVRPVWEAMALQLRRHGYSVRTAVLNAEQYGVPQTRRRAILLAHRDRRVHLPTPTHSRFYSRDRARLDPTVQPWVSMADALGWPDRELVEFARRADTDDAVELDGELYRSRDLQTSDQPAQVVTEKSRSWSRWYRPTTMPNTTVRHADEPAPTVAFGHDANSARWMMGAGASHTDGQQGDPRIGRPGHKDRQPGGESQFDSGSVRVSVEEAAALQSFPPGFPWRGSKTKQYQQIGNAIPPLLAYVILREVAK